MSNHISCRTLRHPHIEQLECRTLLAGLGSVVAMISEEYRDFSFDVHGSATGTNSVADLG